MKMRRTHFFAPTLRETPADATAISHKLMLRAGLVRMLAAGIYSYLPLGWTIARKVMDIIRDEMERIGAQEIFMPALNPIEIWDETGRSKDFGEEMFRLMDRKRSPHCLAPTHEEIICSLARGQLRSWRDLPQIWYQIQIKFRDEPRPRGGMLRMRQFIMKDAYSLDRNEEGLDHSYELHREAYERIFERCGLDYFIVGASSGLMGGGQSQEFMVESEAGEDNVARCHHCGYAANVEVATSTTQPLQMGESADLTEVSTPTQRTVEEVSKFLKIPQERLVKTLVYISPTGPVIALVAGDDDLSEAKLMRIVGGQVRPAQQEEVSGFLNAEVGFLGPHGDHGLPVYADLRLEDAHGMVTGANRNGYHVTGLDLERDVHIDEFADLRNVKEGEGCPVCGRDLKVVKSIELGHIFKLGTKYSKAMNAVFLDEAGKERPIIMGSYGIGVDRILAAAIESNYDENGTRWNSELTPFDAVIIPIGGEEAVVSAAEKLYQTLFKSGLRTMIDDRNARPGVKMKDADLIGIHTHIIISNRNLDDNKIEIKDRWGGDREFVAPNMVEKEVRAILDASRVELD